MCLKEFVLLYLGRRHCTAILSANAFEGGSTGLFSKRAAVGKQSDRRRNLSGGMQFELLKCWVVRCFFHLIGNIIMIWNVL